MTVERYLGVRITKWYTVYFNPKKAVITSIVVISTILAFNGHLLISNGYVENYNGTLVVQCYDSKMYALFPLWGIVSI